MPNVTQAFVNPGQTPLIEWITDEEGGARPVECYSGIITEMGSNGKEIPFDLCLGSNPRGLEYAFQGYDPSKQYSVVVCARNRQGQRCSLPATLAPSTYPPLPATTDIPTSTTLSSTTAAPPQQEANVGLIVGVVVLALLCCGLLLLLLIVCLCSKKKCLPKRRGEST